MRCLSLTLLASCLKNKVEMMLALRALCRVFWGNSLSVILGRFEVLPFCCLLCKVKWGMGRFVLPEPDLINERVPGNHFDMSSSLSS